ncbi:MAG: hypothetical protein WKH64_10070 [Chloroflexia bacterium]
MSDCSCSSRRALRPEQLLDLSGVHIPRASPVHCGLHTPLEVVEPLHLLHQLHRLLQAERLRAGEVVRIGELIGGRQLVEHCGHLRQVSSERVVLEQVVHHLL